MASLLLLTQEQALRNKALFERAPAGSEYSRPPPPPPVVYVSSDGVASTLAVGNGTVKSGYPPPPSATIFSDASYHENVISTFFSTAMTAVNYVPNSPTQSAEEQAKAFTAFVGELSKYGSYFPLEYSKKDFYEHASSDCKPLLTAINSFIKAVESTMGAKNAAEIATGVTDMITTAISTIGSSSSEKVEKTLYSVYRVNGDVVGKLYPVGTIFYSSVFMERHTSGKSTAEKQRVELYSYSYMILSPVVVENANALADASPVSVNQFVDAVNKNVP